MKQTLLILCLLVFSFFGLAQTPAEKGFFRIVNEKTVLIPRVREKHLKQTKYLTEVVEHDGYYDCYFYCSDEDARTAGQIKTPHYLEVYQVSIESGEVLAPVIRVYEEPKVEAPFYEDAYWICQTRDYGEFGAYVWFIEKATGKEFLYELQPQSINSVGGVYFITTPYGIYRIESPSDGIPCDDNLRFEANERNFWDYYPHHLPLNKPKVIYQIQARDYASDDEYIEYEHCPAIPRFASSLYLDKSYYVIQKDNRSFIGLINNQQISRIYSFPFKLSKASSGNESRLYVRNGLKGQGLVVIDGYDITLYNIQFVPSSN